MVGAPYFFSFQEISKSRLRGNNLTIFKMFFLLGFVLLIVPVQSLHGQVFNHAKKREISRSMHAANNIEKPTYKPLRMLSIRFDCSKVDSEEISELLFELGTSSVSVTGECEDSTFLNTETRWSELGKQRSWSTAVLEAIFPATFDVSGLSEILRSTFPEVHFDFILSNIEDLDWVSHVQKNWTPQIIDNLTIKFPWHTEHLVSTPYELVLEGGAAFGTGDHPTTRLCTRWLEKVIVNERDNNISVLDFGCGSGILGLASLRFGAFKSVGVDIDLDALASARNNCKLNNLNMMLYCVKDDDGGSSEIDEDNDASESVSMKDEVRSVVLNTLKGQAAEGFEYFPTEAGDKFDIIVANILAPILISQIPLFSRKLRLGGKIALSGLVESQSKTLMQRFQESGHFYDMQVVAGEENWVLVTGTRGES